MPGRASRFKSSAAAFPGLKSLKIETRFARSTALPIARVNIRTEAVGVASAYVPGPASKSMKVIPWPVDQTLRALSISSVHRLKNPVRIRALTSDRVVRGSKTAADLRRGNDWFHRAVIRNTCHTYQ